MTESGDWLLRPRRKHQYRLRPVALLLVAVAAILFQIYVPLFFHYLSYLEMPLLVTVYFSLMRREPVAGVLIGSSIGLVQDSLSHNPIGMFGIVKTLVGYFAASVSQRFDVQNTGIRFLLGFFFFFFHQFFYWVLANALLGQTLGFDALQTLVFGLLNATVAVPLFHVLDKL
ncbi:MAG: rod shape-determining protein MreD [Acidobacteriia bacterium]|nr:rod shape-determining protein MreD [Terriglobia bacterium]